MLTRTPDDGSLLNGLQSIDSWQDYFHHPSSNILGLMISAGFLPGLIVCWLSDAFGHRYGRRPTVWLCSVFAVCLLLGSHSNSYLKLILSQIIGALVISLATSRGMFIGGRAVLGIGVQGALVMAPSWLQEIAHPRYRATIGGFCKILGPETHFPRPS